MQQTDPIAQSRGQGVVHRKAMKSVGLILYQTTGKRSDYRDMTAEM